MTPYQISSEIYGGFYYPGITLSFLMIDQDELVPGSFGKRGIVKEITGRQSGSCHRELYFYYLQKAFLLVNRIQPKTSCCDG